MSEIAIRKQKNKMRNGINRTELILKVPLITARECQKGINDSILNNHEQYLPLMISHYCPYFINNIKLFYLIHTVKSH